MSRFKILTGPPLVLFLSAAGILYLVHTARALQPGAVTLNPDQTITAIAGIGLDAITCTVLPLRWTDTDNVLQVECQQGADFLLRRGFIWGNPQVPSFSIYAGSGDYVSFTANATNWIVAANGTLLQGQFPPPPSTGPADLGTLVNGICQPFGSGFHVVPGTPSTDGTFPDPGQVLGNEAQGNCILQ